VQELG
jgi:hypothetical protein